MSTHSEALNKLVDPKYRSAFVASQINIQVPFQIRAMRKQRGWTQPDLAAKSEMKQPRISAMEKPGGANFNLETLKRLAEAFDVALIVRFAPFSELIDWSDRFSPDNFEVPGFPDELPKLEREAAKEQKEAEYRKRLTDWASVYDYAAINRYAEDTERMAKAARADVSAWNSMAGGLKYSDAKYPFYQQAAKLAIVYRNPDPSVKWQVSKDSQGQRKTMGIQNTNTVTALEMGA